MHQAEGTASAKAQSWDCAWLIGGAAGDDWSEWGEGS